MKTLSENIKKFGDTSSMPPNHLLKVATNSSSLYPRDARGNGSAFCTTIY